jgi:carbon monoxide dehydrogenase subunit G
MAEQLINEFTVNRPIDQAWAIITDVERIAPCLPGAELQEIEGETYRGVVKVKLGAISSQFKGEANFLERDDAAYRAVIKGVGRDTGGRGNASAEITAQAESLSPTSTKVIVSTDLHITGKVAQFGRGIMGDVSSKLMAQFANNLNEMLDEQGLGATSDETAPADAAAAAPATETEAEAETSDAADAPATAGADTGTTTGTTTTGTTTTGTTTTGTTGAPAGSAAASQVRKINGPATEPIDLMEVGGSSILKRAVPAAVALLLVLLVLRRRRG